MNDLMPRVNAILDVYCEVLKKDMNDDEVCKALDLFCLAQIAPVNLRKSATDVRIRQFTNSGAPFFNVLV